MPVCELKDGAPMAYADDGVGPPVLLVHGWAAHGGFFDGLRERLRGQHRVLTPCLRGHPGSGHGSAPLTIETLGEDIAHFVETLGLEQVVALGWSMGAMALWSAAPRLRDRLAGLIVEEMGPRLTNDEDWGFGLGGTYAQGDIAATVSEIEQDWPSYVARLAPRMFSASTRAARPELVAWAAEEMAKADERAMASYWASMAAQDFRAALDAFEAPMLVVRGGDSTIHPEGATKFAARTVRQGKHVVIPGAGHVPHLEAPDLFFEHVEAFARNAREPDFSRGVGS